MIDGITILSESVYRGCDSKLCFGGGWFIVGIDTPEGSYTYHYENKYFDLFDCEILDYGKHWDGHTEKDVTRLLSLQDDTDTNVGDKISKFIDGFEETFAYVRECEGGDSVCGLCEYDGAYIGESGDWCNECPGFDKDDCFKLKEELRKKWTNEILAICKHFGSDSEIPNSSDLISRQAAIDALKEHRALFCDNTPNSFSKLPYGEKCRVDELDNAIATLVNLPSAQPEPIRINLNEPIKVKLTDWGKEIYYHQYDRTNQIAGRKICKPKFPKEDENGYTEFQLWCFIELYGEHMGMTLPNVIEPLEIVYER